MGEAQAMSRREGRDSHAKRTHSRSEREPSPKKSRRDGKQATERTYTSSHRLDVDTLDRDQKQQRRLPDALPLEKPPATETKVQPEIIKDGLDKKVDVLPDGVKNSSNPTEVPRSRSYFQHDERGSAGHAGRSSVRRATDHGRWSDLKEQPRDRFRERVELHRPHRTEDSNVWRHDRFLELETDAPPARKRPAFREKKIEAIPETETATATAANGSETGRLHTARKEERGHFSRSLESRPDPRADERNFKRGDGPFQRGEMQKGGYQPRERFGGGSTRGRDRFSGHYGDRNTHRPAGFQVEKWKHDLFDEANMSPPPKNEEEQIAKVEALLAL